MHKAGVKGKPENFLIDTENNKVAVCDFGASIMSTSGNTDNPIFTDPQSRGTKQYQCDAYKCDIIALGVTLFNTYY